MPEVYTCVCAHQDWIVYGMGSAASGTTDHLHIECRNCGSEYSVPFSTSASEFNEKRAELAD